MNVQFEVVVVVVVECIPPLMQQSMVTWQCVYPPWINDEVFPTTTPATILSRED